MAVLPSRFSYLVLAFSKKQRSVLFFLCEKQKNEGRRRRQEERDKKDRKCRHKHKHNTHTHAHACLPPGQLGLLQAFEPPRAKGKQLLLQVFRMQLSV